MVIGELCTNAHGPPAATLVWLVTSSNSMFASSILGKSLLYFYFQFNSPFFRKQNQLCAS